jgi:transposase
MSAPTFAAYVGIDWADSEHAVCVLSPEELSAECDALAQQAEALDAWAAKLRARFGGRPIAVCLEASRGPLVYALMKYEHLVLFPLNPKQLAKYRQAFAPSGAKDDPGDAELLARFLREHHARLRAWRPDDAMTRELRLLGEDRRGWVDERTAAGNRLLRHLKEVYPLALALCGKHVYADTFLQLLKRFPSEHELRRASPKQLARYLPKRRRVADDSEVDPRITAIRQAKPLVTDAATLRHGRLAVKHLVAQLEQLNATIDEYDREIAALVAKHPERKLFASFRGAGEALVPRLIAAFGSDRERFASAAELQAFTGVAPVTVQSGKSRRVKMRHACPHFLRQTFHEFARCSLKTSRWAQAYCAMLRAKGHKFHSAIRALAFKWLRILFRCWQAKQPYDEARYLERLRQTQSPLLAYLPTPPPTLYGA